MSDLKKLVDSNDHISISQIPNPSYQPIAHIHLDQYTSALKLTTKGTFEHCYCLYKLKKYKKCIKHLDKLKNKEDKHYIMLAQALYNLHYYNKALEIFSRYKNSTALINAEAIVSLIKACTQAANIQKYVPSCKDGCYEYNEVDYEFNEEERLEFEYNRTFGKLSDEDEYVKELEERVDNVYCRNQLNNVTGNYGQIDDSVMTKRQREIVEYNKSGGVCEGVMHFQKGNAEYKHFKENKNRNSAFIRDHYNINSWKMCRMKGKNKRFDINMLQDKELKKMMQILITKKLSQDELKAIVLKYKE